MVKLKSKSVKTSKASKGKKVKFSDSSVVQEDGLEDEMDTNKLVDNPIDDDYVDDKEESTDEIAHESLLKSFGVDDDKKKKKKKIKEKLHHIEPSEKDIAGRITVSELISSVSKSSALKSVEKLLESTKNKDVKTLDVPLPRFQREQAEREVNYDKAKKDVTKWQPIVKRNRETEHMAFPLYHTQATKIKEDVTSFANKRSKPSNDLEAEVFAVLEAEKEFLERPDTFLTEAEEKTLERLNAEEAEQRRQELSRMRALLSYHEEKFRRKKKIKSKKYHKILKKEKQKNDEKQIADELKENPDNITLEADKADYLRALERMSQKHKVGGKWNKNLLHKNIKNPELKKALSEQRQLRQKLMEKAEDSEEETAGLVEESISSPVPETTTTSPPEKLLEEEYEVDANNPWLIVGSILTEKSSFPGPQVSTEVPVSENPEENKSEVSETESESESEAEKGTPRVDLKKELLQQSDTADQEAMIDMAFANDDVVAQFAEEKQQIVDDETEKDIDLTLPGWGSWSGVGVKDAKPKKRIIKKAPPQKPRKDANLDHVIINTKKNRKIEPHLVKNLPHPYKSRDVFERELRQPIGPQWNSVRSFKNMIKPLVSTVDGQVINPIVAPKGFDNVKIKRNRVK